MHTIFIINKIIIPFHHPPLHLPLHLTLPYLPQTFSLLSHPGAGAAMSRIPFQVVVVVVVVVDKQAQTHQIITLQQRIIGNAVRLITVLVQYSLGHQGKLF